MARVTAVGRNLDPGCFLLLLWLLYFSKVSWALKLLVVRVEAVRCALFWGLR